MRRSLVTLFGLLFVALIFSSLVTLPALIALPTFPHLHSSPHPTHDDGGETRDGMRRCRSAKLFRTLPHPARPHDGGDEDRAGVCRCGCASGFEREDTPSQPSPPHP